MLANRTYLSILYLKSFLVFTAVSPAVKEVVHLSFNACTMASESHLKNTSNFLFIHEVSSTLHSTKAFPINQFNYSILSEYHCAYLGIFVSSPSTYAFDFPLEKCKDETTPRYLFCYHNLVNNNLATTQSLKSWRVILKERFWFNKKKKIEPYLNHENYIVLFRLAFQIFQCLPSVLLG